MICNVNNPTNLWNVIIGAVNHANSINMQQYKQCLITCTIYLWNKLVIWLHGYFVKVYSYGSYVGSTRIRIGVLLCRGHKLWHMNTRYTLYIMAVVAVGSLQSVALNQVTTNFCIQQFDMHCLNANKIMLVCHQIVAIK